MTCFRHSIALLSLIPFTACASIIEGSTQKVTVQTSPPMNAQCNLKNERGTWQNSTPSQTELKRSKSDLNIECASADYSGKIAQSADAESWTFLNLLLGGIIGLGVDAGTGAMFSYNDTITVPMKEAGLAAPAPVSTIVPSPAPVNAPFATVPSPAAQQTVAPASPVRGGYRPLYPSRVRNN